MAISQRIEISAHCTTDEASSSIAILNVGESVDGNVTLKLPVVILSAGDKQYRILLIDLQRAISMIDPTIGNIQYVLNNSPADNFIPPTSGAE